MSEDSKRLSLEQAEELVRRALTDEPGVRLPGARRHEFRQRAESEGVDVPQELIDRLEGFAS